MTDAPTIAQEPIGSAGAPPALFVVDFTDEQLFTGLKAFLFKVTGAEVRQGQLNRVPQPASTGYIIMTAMRQLQLATPVDTLVDEALSAVQQSTRFDVQLDFYGPSSGSQAKAVTMLFRNAFACDFLAEYGMQPLYCDDGRQMPLINGEFQYEARWMVQAVMQANPSVSVPQQSAIVVTADVVEVDDYPQVSYDISTLDMAAIDPGLAITEGLAWDAPYLYVTPHNEYIVAKIDTRTFEIVATLDLSETDPAFTGFLGAFASGGYLYILPHMTGSSFYQTEVVRVDLSDFTTVDSLTIRPSASASEYGGLACTDGTYGYQNTRVPTGMSCVRFGLGDDFTLGNVSTLSLTAVGSMSILRGNFITCDADYLYGIAVVITYPGTGMGDRLNDLWLVRIPLNDFQDSAAIFDRITTLDFVAGHMVVPFHLLDDGENLWTFPLQIAGETTYLGSIQIPKSAPTGATVWPRLPYQSEGTLTTGTLSPFYDGYRYGYITSSDQAKILQLDTHNPGGVNLIDIAHYSSISMTGLVRDDRWGYAVSFNGGGGLCLRFRPPGMLP